MSAQGPSGKSTWIGSEPAWNQIRNASSHSVRVVVREVHAERRPGVVPPFLLGHLSIPTAEPRDVLTPARLAFRIEEEFPVPEVVPPEDRMLGTQLKQFAA